MANKLTVAATKQELRAFKMFLSKGLKSAKGWGSTMSRDGYFYKKQIPVYTEAIEELEKNGYHAAVKLFNMKAVRVRMMVLGVPWIMEKYLSLAEKKESELASCKESLDEEIAELSGKLYDLNKQLENAKRERAKLK
jgi:hypothetical protein